MSSPSRSVPRQLFALALPIIGINVLGVLMLAVDSALCGRLPNAEAVLEALGYAIQIIFLLMVAMLGLIVGTVALVARAYGARATGRVEELLLQSTQLTVLFGIVVGVAGALLAGPLFGLLGARPEVAAIGVEYLRPLMLGTPCFYLTLLYAGLFRAVGNTRVPFLCAIVANILNAVLCYGLVLGKLGLPALGVLGAAIATVIAQTANMLALVAALRRGLTDQARLMLRPQPIDRKLAIEMFRVGWPAALDMLVLNAGFLSALGMLGRIDGTTVAAHGLGLRVQALAFVPGLGIAQATGALVGQALGAGNPDQARRVARAAMVLCATVMTALALMIVFAAGPLVQIFDVDPDTRLGSYAVEWMRLLGASMLPAAFNIALIGVLQGAGATMTSLRINFMTTLVVQVPLAWLLGFPLELGALGVWLSFPLAFVVKSLAVYAVYRSGSWATTGIAVRR
ncbi:MAG TPA: MATE family efflux transporter [Kofleriaceae bacterium]|nr:MATE family efflux transporter [Kofleriaceae bacterium]